MLYSGYFFGAALRMMVFWNQAWFMRLRKAGLISYPALSPIKASLPHLGQSAVSPLALSGLLKLSMFKPLHATISSVGKTSRHEQQPHSLLASSSARLFIV
jgi:hypothetical protein